MSQLYPITIVADDGVTELVGKARFTDPALQPQPPFPLDYLVATVKAAISTGGGSHDFEWTLVDHVGSSINVDGVDDHLLNIVTSGVYDIVVVADVDGDATGAGIALVQIGGSIAAAPWLNTAAPFVNQTVTPPDYLSVACIVAPSIKVVAPVTVKVSVTLTIGAGAIAVGGDVGSILVRRIA